MRGIKATLGLAVLLGCLVLGAVQAQAAVLYVKSGSFDGAATEDKNFENSNGIAFHQASERVSLNSWYFGTVPTFTKDGGFVSENNGETIVPEGGFQKYAPTQIAIDNSGGAFDGYQYFGGDFWESDSVLWVFDGAGKYKGRVTGTTTKAGKFVVNGIAVDNYGSVYVADGVSNDILKYTPSGGPIDDSDLVQEIDKDGISNPTSMAFDAADNLYVTNGGNSFVKFNAALENKGPVGGTLQGCCGPTSVVISQAGGEYFFNYGSEVVVTDSANTVISRFRPDAGTIAVSEAERRVYALRGPVVEYWDGADVASARTDNPTNLFRPGATLNGTLNPDGNGNATCEFEYGLDPNAYSDTADCSPAGPFSGTSDQAVSANVTELPTEVEIHYRLAVTSPNGTNYGDDKTFSLKAVPGLKTDAATDVEAFQAVLHGSFDPAGEDTEYYFEWGESSGYGNTIPVPPTKVPGSAVGVQDAKAALTGLEEAHTYNYRIVAVNKHGTSYGENKEFKTKPVPPIVNSQKVTDVHADSAILYANITPGGEAASFRFEYGTAPCSANPCDVAPIPDAKTLDDFDAEEVAQFVKGLKAGTTYYFRVIATNPSGEDKGADRSFTTFPIVGELGGCPNAHVRQQTSAALLLDCRAYELVTAVDTGGYNVEADLVPGQHPFGGYPDANSPTRVLYAVNDGGIPGTGSPTNHGPDPYVATRGDNGWTTAYVGIPSDMSSSSAPFGSPVLEASADLSTFAFGGADICDPCFSDGSTNLPTRASDGGLIQGMAGSLNPGPADPAGTVRKRISADGAHLVFGSTAKFEADGNSNGDVTIYDRNLKTGTTQVVSKLPNGTTMTGPGIAQLDMSPDGSRIVVAKRVSVDASGNAYWHPYLHVGGSANTIDLAPGSASGVLYGGMTADGSTFYFSTRDKLDDDTDTSVDLYRATVTGTSVDLTRVSTGAGGTGNTDGCTPVSNSSNVHWNNVDAATADCSTVAIAGGGGIAKDDGSVYLLSPELLDGAGKGTQDAPNLYLARPGAPPAYVTTLESELTGPLALPTHPFEREQGIIGNPKSLAVDSSNGDLYVLDQATKSIQRYDANGEPLPFSASQSYVNDNRITGTPGGSFGFGHFSGKQQIAVASSGGPTDGYVYVTNGTEAGGIDVFDSTGAYKGQMPNPEGNDCGVATGPGGTVYVGSVSSGIIKYTPVDGNPANDVKNGATGGFGICQVAVDSTGAAYGHYFFFQRVEKYTPSSFGGVVSFKQVVPDFSGATSIAVDRANDNLLVNRGDNFFELDSSGKEASDTRMETVSGSQSIAADTDGEVYVGSPPGASIAVFGSLSPGFDPEADSPIVVHGVNDAETHRYADFQISPSGDHAAFPSTLALTGYDTARHIEVYLHDAIGDAIECTSCAPTGVQASGDAALATNGLSLSDDGRVFFNSTDELAPRDLNKRKDAYQYSDGKIELISTGTSAYDSSLLGISADGTDAYFFTRQQLVEEDRNGTLVRIYNARSGGGFARLPAQVDCQASDECHGPGTAQGPNPPIGTFKGTLGNEKPKPKADCKKGFKKNKKGKCVKKPKKRKRNKSKRGNR